MSKRQKPKFSEAITDEEFEQVMQTFDPETAACIRAQRNELTEMGVTREPLRTRMACDFASVLIASRAKPVKKSATRRKKGGCQ